MCFNSIHVRFGFRHSLPNDIYRCIGWKLDNSSCCKSVIIIRQTSLWRGCDVATTASSIYMHRLWWINLVVLMCADTFCKSGLMVKLPAPFSLSPHSNSKYRLLTVQFKYVDARSRNLDADLHSNYHYQHLQYCRFRLHSWMALSILYTIISKHIYWPEPGSSTFMSSEECVRSTCEACGSPHMCSGWWYIRWPP